MKKARLRAMLQVFGVAVLATVISAAPASAQTSDDCRCVDRDGNEIENCSCFSVSPLRGLIQGLAFSTDSRPRIGISVDPQQSARNDARGARVTALMDDGPADEAGIRVGDMITSLDGHSLFEPLSGDAEDDFDLDVSIPVQRLLTISAELEPGQQIEVEYARRGETLTATLEAQDLSSWGSDSGWGGFDFARPTLGRSLYGERSRGVPNVSDLQTSFEFRGDNLLELRLNLQELAERAQEESRRHRVRVRVPRLGMRHMHGIELIEMKPGLASYFGTEEGMLVTNVDEDSTLGLEPGDVILRIGDRDATSPARVLRILSTYDEDEEIMLRILRNHDEITVKGRLGG
jgi:membrane-associated protease RseP (regulator of RpoE activity)